ncbi:FAD/NAD(P)-binding protein [Hymenobacter seoulensis]
MQRKTITILGGGFCGSMLAVQLARLAGSRPFACDVHLVEPRLVPGPGTAYTARRAEYLLNVRSQNLSAFPDQPDHFINWLRATNQPQCPSEFCSRQTYGRYLQQLIGQVLQWPSPNGIRCHWHNYVAKSVRVAADGTSATVRLSNNEEIISDYVVLALGNFPPLPPTRSDLSYLTHPNYHGNPWAPGALETIRTDDTVLIIGTGLTAVDMLMGLRADGHQGTITVVSGHGRWPREHTKPTGAYPSFYASELAGLGSVGEVVRVVRRHVQTAKEQGLDWRAVIDSMRPDLGHIWAAWPLVEQDRFLRHLAGFWSVIRHRCPPQSAATVQQMFHEGLLHQEKGRVQHIEVTESGFSVVIQSGSAPERRLSAQHVITCTGPLLDYSRTANPAVISLRESGHLQPDTLRLGIQTDEHGALLNATGAASPLLFTLGPSRRPAFFESTAVPELRMQVAALAQELGSRMRAIQ